MLLHVPDIFSQAALATIRDRLREADWQDGAATAGVQSACVKNNLQLPQSSETAKALSDIVLRALEQSPLFMSAALPRHVFPPLFNKYAAGMSFGAHVDNAIRQIPGTSHRIRTDLSCTLFLSEPDEYDGGELVIEDSYGAHAIKLPAGDMILYPADSLHHVSEVTRGARIASFFWTQSMVRDDGQRRLLFEMDAAIQGLARKNRQAPEILSLTNTYHNLVRRWADV